MNREVNDALSGIKSAWKNMLEASDRETYEFNKGTPELLEDEE